jgi:hypothetical protein
MDRFHAFGVCLSCFGVFFSLFSYLILVSVPLTALGVGVLIVGLSILLTPSTPIPKKAVRELLEGSIVNSEAILEEFNLSSKGYYTPSSDGKVYVYIPFSSDSGPPKTSNPPKGLVSTVDGKPYLTLIPPMFELARFEESSSLEASISEALVDLTELCESVNIFQEDEDTVTVEAKGVRGHVGAGRFKKVLGSLEASIAATITAKTLGKPVYIETEKEKGKTRQIKLKVVGG